MNSIRIIRSQTCITWSGPFLVQSRSKMYVNKKRKIARKKHKKNKWRRQRYRRHFRMGTALATPKGKASTFFARPDNDCNPFDVPDILSQVSVEPPYRLLYAEPPEMKSMSHDFFGGILPEKLLPRGITEEKPEPEGTGRSYKDIDFEKDRSYKDIDFEKDWKTFMSEELDGQGFNTEEMDNLFEASELQSDDDNYNSFLNEVTDESFEIDDMYSDQKSDELDLDSLFKDFEKQNQ